MFARQYNRQFSLGMAHPFDLPQLLDTGPSTENLLALFDADGVDSVGLSVDDYASVDEYIRDIFFEDESTLRDGAAARTLALASPLLNVDTMISSGDTVYLYSYGTSRTITDSVVDYVGASRPTAFITVWETTTPNETITLPLRSGYNYDFDVDWGDGSTVDNIAAYNQTEITHTYAEAGKHIVSIEGVCEAWYQNNAGDKEKLLAVLNLGDVSWKRLDRAFYGCSSITRFVAGNTDTSQVTSMNYMMCGWSSMISPPDLSFDTSQVTGMYSMMRDWSSMSDISINVYNFNVSALTTAGSMLSGSSLDTETYDATLISFASQSVNSGLNIHFGSSKYTPGGAAEAARDTLINTYGWTITDGGPVT